jgi:hypothetical protein
MTDNEKPGAGGAGLSMDISSEGRNSSQSIRNDHFSQRICVEETRQFCDVIRPAKECTCQTIDDSPQKRPNLLSVRHGAGDGRALAGYNHRGAGVFVAANPMRPGGRSKHHVINVPVILADFDNGVPASIPIEPTLRVRTSVSADALLVRAQWWWSLCDGETLTTKEQCGIMRCLVAHYGADPNAVDIARCGRLPGFMHMKGEPQLVRIVGGTGRPVRKRDLIEAFPAPPEPERPKMPIERILQSGDRYLAGTARRLSDEVARAPEGQRNSTLNYAAFRLGQLGADEKFAASYLAPAAAAAGLHIAEIRRTIASGIAGARRRAGA